MGVDGFDKRQEGFETKFEREQDQDFRARARRDKQFAIWAAGLMGLEGDAVDAYKKDVIAAALTLPGDDDILGKVEADLAAKGIERSRGDLQLELDRCARESAN